MEQIYHNRYQIAAVLFRRHGESVLLLSLLRCKRSASAAQARSHSLLLPSGSANGFFRAASPSARVQPSCLPSGRHPPHVRSVSLRSLPQSRPASSCCTASGSSRRSQKSRWKSLHPIHPPDIQNLPDHTFSEVAFGFHSPMSSVHRGL